MTGMFVTSKAGRDKNQIYIIIKEEGEYVYLVDGKYKTVEHPKKKSKKHIQPIHKYVNEIIVNNLAEQKPIQNEVIKRAIKLYNRAI